MEAFWFILGLLSGLGASILKDFIKSKQERRINVQLGPFSDKDVEKLAHRLSELQKREGRVGNG